jgi:hypothetical protein
MEPVDQRVVRLVRQVDQERQQRLKAEQRERMLRAQLIATRRALVLARTTDSVKPAERPE